MANTLTDLIPDIYAAMNIVSRELVGFVPSVTMDARVDRVAKGETVRVPIAPAGTPEDITPSTTPPDTGDQTFENATVSITKARAVPFRWTGEEQRGVNYGPGYQNLRANQIAEALRALVNEVESDVAALYTGASRAAGTAGTTPFGTANDLSDIAEVRQILDDNGAPQTDLQLVLGSAAMAKIRGTQSSLWKVNEAGTQEMLREGFISQGLQGFALRNSGQVKSHTAGTGSGYLLDDASAAVGDTVITVDTGTGTIIAGDVVTFDGDTNKYVVGTALSGSTFSINKPGLRVAEDDNDAITVGSAFTANLAFSRSALVLAARQPAVPEEGDAAADRMSVTDPMSGITFEFSVYPQYRRVRYEVGLAWGASVIKPEHVALLLG